MDNISVKIPLVDGSVHEITRETETGKQFIQALFGDDWGAPPRSLVIKAVDDDGKAVTITIPYDNTRTVHVIVEDEVKINKKATTQNGW